MASQLNQEKQYINTDKSKQDCIVFRRCFNWFNEEFTNRLGSISKEFLANDIHFHLLAITNKPSILWKSSEYFVTQIEFAKDCSIFLKISNNAAQIILDSAFGKRNEEELRLTNITELEAKILTSYNQFLYKNLEKTFISKKERTKIISSQSIGENNVHLTFYIYSNDIKQEAGKIILSFPEYLLKKPVPVQSPVNPIDIFQFKTSYTRADIFVGKSRISLEELKNLEKEDMIILEKSNLHTMKLIGEEEIPFKVNPDPGLVINIDNIDGGQPEMNELESQSKNIWDSLQVELSAEFKKIKVSLGELRQITEGLVIDVAPIVQNQISLHVEGKELALGELVIIGDKYGVKITQVFQETKEEQEIATRQAAVEEINEKLPEEPIAQESEADEFDDSDFDYSDFEIEDDI
ncbi:MAG: FliM/FliN family flagellar motor switch protein [Candidatus Gastranaerophilales bacterium]|nr:FliM/FliN family flagellar motor switch protein [Candidatus Gastranaerophilales bacterium]